MNFDPNGWYPRVTVDGDRIFVAYGNGQVRLAEILADGTVLRDELIASAPGTTNWRSFWSKSNELTVFSLVTGEQWVRSTLDVRGPWVLRASDDDPTLVAGNQHAVTPDLWASWFTRDMRLCINGTQEASSGGALSAGGEYVACADSNSNAEIAVRHVRNGLIGKHRCVVPLHETMTAPGGSVAYGSFGPLHGVRVFNGQLGPDEDLGVTPWNQEWCGQAWIGEDGHTWVSTLAYSGDGGMILLRPWGEKACVIVRRLAVHVSIVEHEGFWIIASCDDVGRLNVDRVSFSAPRERVQETVSIPVIAQPRAVWRGLCAGGPGNATWGPQPNDSRPILEGAWWCVHTLTDAERARVRWVLFSPKDTDTRLWPGGVEEEYRVCVAFLKDHPLARLAVYGDDATYTQWAWVERAKREGVRVMRAQNAYPFPALGEHDRPDLTADRVRAVLSQHGDYADIVIRPAYVQGGAWSTLALQQYLPMLDAVIQEQKHVEGDFAFGQGRPGGAYQDWPWYQEYWATLVARTPLPKETTMGKCSIVSYSPSSGAGPLDVTLIGAASGDVRVLEWRWRRAGDNAWTVSARNPATDLDHHIIFNVPGEYELSLRGLDDSGRVLDETGARRVVTVTAAPVNAATDVFRRLHDNLNELEALFNQR